jgi:DNA-directed RNA polymerase sigma subunit (sigma70/sigma32)
MAVREKRDLTVVLATTLPTRDKVRQLRRLDRTLKGIELAALLGVSRERIRQLLVDMKLKTRVRGELRGGWRPRKTKRAAVKRRVRGVKARRA